MEQRIFSDLDLAFSKHPVTNDVTRKTKENAVIASVKHILNTNYFERPFNPTLGSNITGMLFEPVDDVTGSILQKEIINVLTEYEPRVKIDEVIVSPDPDNNRYDVTLRFYIRNSIKPVVVNLFLNRLR